MSNSSYPTIVDDAAGHINVAWIDSVSGINFSRSTDGGQSFVTTLIGAISVGAVFQPQMVVDSTGNIIEIAWAKPSATSSASNPSFDVFVSRSINAGAAFLPTDTKQVSKTSVALVGAPRLAFDGAGVDVVWGNADTWIAQSPDGLTFSAPIKLSTAGQDSGGPRIAVDKNGNIFVAWTDRLAQIQDKQGNYCTNPISHTDPNGLQVYTNLFGGNYYINETMHNSTVPSVPSSAATRNLSNEWTETSYPNGYFGCSYDSLHLFFDSKNNLHLLWADEAPLGDLLTTTAVPQTNGPPKFPFPMGLGGGEGVGSPSVATDNLKSIYVAWAAGARAPASTEGIYFSRSDDYGANFFGGNLLPEASVISAPGAISPAYPQIAVDSVGNVDVVWEQADQPITASSSNTFHLFFARSTDRGDTFPTIREVWKNPSVLCIASGATPPTTPDRTICGTVQMGLDANSNADMAWVDNPGTTGSTANIDFSIANVATQPTDDFNISVTSPTPSAFSGQTVTYNVTASATGTFGNSAITLGCNNFPELSGTTQGSIVTRSDYSCTFPPPASGILTAGNSATVNLTIPSNLPANTVSFAINGTSGGTTHRVKAAVISQGSPGAPGSVQPSSAHIGVGASATFNVNINSNAFSGNVNLVCNGQPAWIQCAFNPQSVTPSTTNNSSVLTVTVVSAPAGTLLNSPPSVRSLPGQRNGVLWSLTGTVLCLLAMALVFGGRREGLNAPILLRGFAVMALTLVLATGLISCGGGGAAAPSNAPTSNSSGTPSGTGSGSGGGTTPVTATFMVQTQAANGTTNLGTVSITTP